jgi:hypothetical protein
MLGMIPRFGKLPTQIATHWNAAIGDAESDAQETGTFRDGKTSNGDIKWGT